MYSFGIGAEVDEDVVKESSSAPNRLNENYFMLEDFEIVMFCVILLFMFLQAMLE